MTALVEQLLRSQMLGGRRCKTRWDFPLYLLKVKLGDRGHYNKGLTIMSDEKGPHTITRVGGFTEIKGEVDPEDEEFETMADNYRSHYNPAMIEVGGSSSESASLRLENIILDDAGKTEGKRYLQAVKKTVDLNGVSMEKGNLDVVQDAIIATYDGTGKIVLGDGAVLRNFGGMSAVRVTGETGVLVMEDGSVIEDTMHCSQVSGHVL